MHLKNSEKYFDPIADNNRQLVEDFMDWTGVSGEVLQFATDYYWVSDWLEAILDYYDLADDFEEFVEENWSWYNKAPERVYNYNLKDWWILWN